MSSNSIGQITESAAIEGSIRHIAQESKHIMFIFSGSNRHLLSNLFDDRTKPLYKLCDRIILDRISAQDYVPFIYHKFNKRWPSVVSIDTIDTILKIAERHPYYVNVLCHKLWSIATPPDKRTVEAAWHKYAMEEKTNISSEIDLLSTNQAKMLISIAKYGDSILPMGKEFIALTRFSLSSASQCIKVLEAKDYIQTNKNHKYFIVDPLIKYIFSGNFYG